MINSINRARYKQSRLKLRSNQRKAKERKRIEVALIEPEINESKIALPRKSKPDIRVRIESSRGHKIQFSAIMFGGKLIGQTFCLSPKQFGRRLGDMFDLWTKP